MSTLIRLTYQNADLRPHLLPLIRKGGGRIKNIRCLTGEGRAFLKKVLVRYPEAKIGLTPGSEILRAKGRFQLDTLHNAKYISISFGIPIRYDSEDDYIIPDLKRRGKIPDSVQTVDDLNEIQEEKKIRQEALVEGPVWFKANGVTTVQTEEKDTKLGGPFIYLYAYFPKSWVR